MRAASSRLDGGRGGDQVARKAAACTLNANGFYVLSPAERAACVRWCAWWRVWVISPSARALRRCDAQGLPGYRRSPACCGPAAAASNKKAQRDALAGYRTRDAIRGGNPSHFMHEVGAVTRAALAIRWSRDAARRLVDRGTHGGALVLGSVAGLPTLARRAAIRGAGSSPGAGAVA